MQRGKVPKAPGVPFVERRAGINYGPAGSLSFFASGVLLATMQRDPGCRSIAGDEMEQYQQETSFCFKMSRG
jgi:hypothetical protein